ncbi:Pentatricopeptide repeat-containing protein [Dorcoceras hygrometricum]|uniref:Pentatricopeptide repeat-containing protein n=1 Tax=Dorcoceras hygrometricum TaxID=472368 RepID=A0A2Z7AEB5_9LAMI|nr:Pentatricopeptide repeat-containing protein [Dorcoceras hygrometricum]
MNARWLLCIDVDVAVCIRCEGERKYRTLISLLGSLATMRRVVNYHSSWAMQRQVELFDASGIRVLYHGNPGFTAGRGYNPAGGAPGGVGASIIQNAIQINFDSVPSLSDEDLLCKCHCARGFSDKFHSGKVVEISEELFAGSFDLSSEGLTTVNELPKELIKEARKTFSASREPIKTSCKKKEMKVEFRLLNDILAKTVTTKAGSFYAVTHQRFLLMAAIHGGIKIYWSKFLFSILKEMVTPSSKQARGFAVQIYILLKGASDLTLGESKAFPPLKILTVKTVGTYVAKNKSVSTTAEEVTDEPVVEKVVKAVAKRRPAPVVEPVSKKQRTTVGRAAPIEKILAIVPVVQEGFREEAMAEQEKEKEGTTEKEIVEEEPVKEKKDNEDTDSEDTEPLSKVLKLTDTPMSDEESMSIVELLKQIPEDMMLPSVTVEEPTRIEFVHGIEIKEVDWYKATFPKIDPMDKGKAPLVEEIKGNPTKEIFALISGDIEFLVQMREAIKKR